MQGRRRAATPSAPPVVFSPPGLDAVIATLESRIPEALPGKATLRKTRKNGTIVTMPANTADAVIAAELKYPSRELAINTNGTLMMAQTAPRPAPKMAMSALNDVRNSNRVFRARIGKPAVVDPAKIKGLNDESAA
jgi:hypothetical protein